jgi:hypothetical protein
MWLPLGQVSTSVQIQRPSPQKGYLIAIPAVTGAERLEAISTNHPVS